MAWYCAWRDRCLATWPKAYELILKLTASNRNVGNDDRTIRNRNQLYAPDSETFAHTVFEAGVKNDN